MSFGKPTFKATDVYQILSSELAAFRELRYDELAELVGETISRQMIAADSTAYAVEIKIRWRDAPGGEILVVGWAAVDDCGPMRRVDNSFV